MSELSLAKFLGPGSYPAILDSINEKLMGAEASTLVGTELLREGYVKLNESATPVMTLREFTTKAEKVAPDDAKLKDIIDFCRKQVKTGDFNFLLNMVKEEKWADARRSGHPDPKSTLKEFEEYFNSPSSVIEQGIKSGIFDAMKSNLLNQVKVDLTGIQPLNENANEPLMKGDLIRYSPVGVKLEVNNSIVMLLENDVLSYDVEAEKFTPLNEAQLAQLEIPSEYRRLMHAIQSCSYNPETKEFSLNENWDFDLKMKSDGNIFIGNTAVEKSDLPKLLLESVNIYQADPTKVQGFNRKNYLAAADDFILLCENCKKLIEFDTLETIRNLSESSYIVLNRDTKSFEPIVLGSSQGHKLFESFMDLAGFSEQVLGSSITELFESQIKDEMEKIAEKNSKIVSLNESIAELNTAIGNVNNLKGMANPGSPALARLNEQEAELSQKLNESLADLNFYKNEFKLH